jgi:hypothetical protein
VAVGFIHVTSHSETFLKAWRHVREKCKKVVRIRAALNEKDLKQENQKVGVGKSLMLKIEVVQEDGRIVIYMRTS